MGFMVSFLILKFLRLAIDILEGLPLVGSGLPLSWFDGNLLRRAPNMDEFRSRLGGLSSESGTLSVSNTLS
jgi:hypothetical protein